MKGILYWRATTGREKDYELYIPSQSLTILLKRSSLAEPYTFISKYHHRSFPEPHFKGLYEVDVPDKVATTARDYITKQTELKELILQLREQLISTIINKSAKP
jgi:hypothetical protein